MICLQEDYTPGRRRRTDRKIVINQIGYITINERFLNAIRDKTYPRAYIKSVHAPLVTKLRFRLKTPIKKATNKSLDMNKIRNPEIKAKLTESNNNSLTTIDIPNDVERNWINLPDAIRNREKEEIGHSEKKKKRLDDGRSIAATRQKKRI